MKKNSLFLLLTLSLSAFAMDVPEKKGAKETKSPAQEVKEVERFAVDFGLKEHASRKKFIVVHRPTLLQLIEQYQMNPGTMTQKAKKRIKKFLRMKPLGIEEIINKEVIKKKSTTEKYRAVHQKQINQMRKCENDKCSYLATLPPELTDCIVQFLLPDWIIVSPKLLLPTLENLDSSFIEQLKRAHPKRPKRFREEGSVSLRSFVSSLQKLNTYFSKEIEKYPFKKYACLFEDNLICVEKEEDKKEVQKLAAVCGYKVGNKTKQGKFYL